MVKKWIRFSFIYLIVVGLLGIFLRMLFFAPIDGVNYRYFLHAHSHVAFLGWVFNALFSGLIFAYLPNKFQQYRLLFWLLQIAVVGMLVTFPIQGYAAASITFTSLHVFLSWWFAVKFLKDTSQHDLQHHRLSLSFIKWSLFFMIFSSIGPFALGAIMAKGLSDTPLANLAIYFYLHFQYDGWFTFAVFGLFFWLIEKHNLQIPNRYAKRFLVLLVIACLPAYSLSTLWTHPPTWVYAVAMLAATLQLFAITYLIFVIKKLRVQLRPVLIKRTKQLFIFALLSFAFKIILQFASAFPAVADLAYTVRNFTIGYLHIVFLGFVTIFLIGWFTQTQLIQLNRRIISIALLLFLVGYILSELLIFLQPILAMRGIILPYYYESLFAVSILMPLGVGAITYFSFEKRGL